MGWRDFEGLGLPWHRALESRISYVSHKANETVVS